MTWARVKEQLVHGLCGAVLSAALFILPLRDGLRNVQRELVSVRAEMQQLRRDLCWAAARQPPNCPPSQHTEARYVEDGQ